MFGLASDFEFAEDLTKWLEVDRSRHRIESFTGNVIVEDFFQLPPICGK